MFITRGWKEEGGSEPEAKEERVPGREEDQREGTCRKAAKFVTEWLQMALRNVMSGEDITKTKPGEEARFHRVRYK